VRRGHACAVTPRPARPRAPALLLGTTDALIARQNEVIMLRAAVVFFVIAIVAAIFGFGGIASSAIGVAKICFYIFAIIAVISLILGLARR
jgi:uncharacterized membrane protein YtjA (UPF0391 family)